MATRDGGSTGGTLLAFALGAVAGAAIALLYAPASGEETRRRVRQKARDGRDRVTDMAEDLKSNVEAAVEHGKEVFERIRTKQAAKENL